MPYTNIIKQIHKIKSAITFCNELSKVNFPSEQQQNTINTSIDPEENVIDLDFVEQVVEDVEEESLDTDEVEEPCFVAVHIGAGYHSKAKTGSYRTLCESICKDVLELLKQGYNARTAVATAVALLENSPLTNAGVGSNLTLDGKIECDASIMDANGFGAVGAVSNIKNPIMIALSLLESQIKGTLSMGRIVPCMLVGEGAKTWATSQNIEEVSDEYLKTEHMIKTHNYYKERLNKLEKESIAQQKEQLTTDQDEDQTRSLDTVGAIVLDRSGHLATAVSSGGILLKHSGRVGHASFFGCGCWLEEDENNLNNHEQSSMAACTTGCGEYIIKTLFARECVAHIKNNLHDPNYKLKEFFDKKFFNSQMLKNCTDKLIGAMVCKLDKEKTSKKSMTMELLVAHTTPSMCFGYASSAMKYPKSVMSRFNEATRETVMISNFNINLLKKTVTTTSIRTPIEEMNSNKDDFEAINKRFKFDSE